MPQKKRRSSAYARASMARLAAVQAFYQILLRDQLPSKVMDEFVLHHLSSEEYTTQPNVDLFRHLIGNAFDRQADIKEMIEKSLTSEWRYDRIEMVLKAILYVSTGEMLARPTPVPAPVIIMEYTSITRSFYEGHEIAFINGYLNRLARHLNYPMSKEENG